MITDTMNEIATLNTIGDVPSSTSKSRGRGWFGDPEGHAKAGQKGGLKIAEDRSHMAEIGRKGGQRVAQDRAHMAAIGRLGGLKAAKKRQTGA
jgi:general stress protein YciG